MRADQAPSRAAPPRERAKQIMTAKVILAELKPLGSDGYKRVMFNHGVKEPCFGVKISELQTIQKRIRKDYQLALDLYDTGNYDAMYLAGLVADDAKMTRKDLQHWVAKAYCRPLCGATLPCGLKKQGSCLEFGQRPRCGASGTGPCDALRFKPESRVRSSFPHLSRFQTRVRPRKPTTMSASLIQLITSFSWQQPVTAFP